MPPTTTDAIRQKPLFAGLSDPEKDALLKPGRLRQFLRGQALFAHGDQVRHVYLLVSGTVQLFRATPDGRQKTIALAAPGQLLCEDEVMDGCRAHRTSGAAVEEAEVLEFPASWLKEASREHPAFAMNLLSLMAHRAHMAEVEAEHRAGMSAAQLVACFLQRLCVLHDFNPKGFDLPYSKTLIASRLGMESETFSRTLAKLKEHGIVVEGTRVAIHDLARIAEYVCSACSISGECDTHRAMERKMGD